MEASRVAVIVEDDRDIRDLIEAVLIQSGFEVHAAASGEEGVQAVEKHDPSIVTLDLGLPDMDGFEVARRIRLFSDSYIIMLTARAEELDTLLGLESGADDYITKPFRPRELRARVAAMLRRPRMGDTGASPVGQTPVPAAPANGSEQPEGNGQTQVAEPATNGNPPGTYLHNGLLLNHQTRTTEVNGQEIELTRTEFDLLHALMESGRVVRTKTDLVRRLRYEDYDTGSFISDADMRAIEVHIGNLRRKLGDNSREPRWLETVRGVGYRLAPKTLR
ncbi:response regulator transcription factor [Arthrobacter sp. VKM Ac-2550]|uniref:response regulator transcription factor n=1 Tax=Crystallibacter permensis TaxID=1938888 RepID=UPI0022279513|nr:response regulator transcription factor [Arthrobacter sp. VKM Ac-2550]MCW2131452.1 DNA-binding response regulator, OmpR family, contains REC and winged-helix (wHTH) domain [Arthrobacter sp. VKM Ac-2550]